jgi:hypothetical protein
MENEMTTYVQKIVNELSDDSESFDVTITQNTHTVFLKFEDEESCDAFLDSMLSISDVERSEDYYRSV